MFGLVLIAVAVPDIHMGDGLGYGLLGLGCLSIAYGAYGFLRSKEQR